MQIARLASAALLAAAATLAPAAPDEAGYGAAAGYPAGTRADWFQKRHLVGAYSGMETLFPVHAVAAGRDVRPLPRADATLDPAFVQHYLDAQPVTGLLVLKDGKVLVERYQYGRGPEHRFTSWSMAKTVVAMALGVAVADGRIRSLDDPVERYEPALAASAWKGVALRDVLTMASGVRFDETYDTPGSDIARMSRAWSRQEGALLDALLRFDARDDAPGERFHYVSANTQVLGQVLLRATGRPLAGWVSEVLWQPLGAEADAAWIVDGAGAEAAYCCFSARLRDWGRLGQLLADGGRRDGRQVIPADWLRAATTPGAPHLRPRRATPYFGYGYQTWIFPDGLGFALLGVHGQAVFVDPRLNLVMVQTAVWPTSSDLDRGRARDAFWRELRRRAARM